VKALTIAWVAIVRLIRERTNIFFVFILPIGIIVIIGAQFGGSFTPDPRGCRRRRVRGAR
jgi:hypothetical protein